MTTVYSYKRFSSPTQAEGASLARQTEAANRWIEAKRKDGQELLLDTTLRMTDEGISAYKGKHRHAGSDLGKFLLEAKAGRVKPGSYLLVENLDRLSREEVPDAQAQFLQIIGFGIHIVTLVDGQECRH